MALATKHVRGGLCAFGRFHAEVPCIVARGATEVIPHASDARIVHAAEQRTWLQLHRLFAPQALDSDWPRGVAKLARRQRRKLRSDADQNMSHDFRVRKTRLPKLQQFGI